MWPIMMVCSGHGGERGGGTVTWQGCIRQRDAGARRLAAPDRALQEGLVWWPPLQAPRSAGTKASAQLKDVNWGAFVPRARGHAEWENWPLLGVRLCLNPLAVSASGTAHRLSGQLWGGGRHKKENEIKKRQKREHHHHHHHHHHLSGLKKKLSHRGLKWSFFPLSNLNCEIDRKLNMTNLESSAVAWKEGLRKHLPLYCSSEACDVGYYSPSRLFG